MRARALRILVVALFVACALASFARADGDPGSDVLVYQQLFLASDAGVSVAQQAALGQLLQAAARDDFPVRVAIIATRSDLGAITGLWLNPRAYARFLGLELSLAYKGRLLVVMPNGFGFNWPGHPPAAAYQALAHVPIGRGAAGMASAAKTGLAALARAAGVKLAAPSAPSSGPATVSVSANGGAAGPSSGSHTDELVAAIAALLLLAAAVLRWRVRIVSAARSVPPRIALGGALAAGVAGTIAAIALVGSTSPAQSDALARNPVLDPGTPLSRPAPDFTLTDQFGQTVSLRSFRAKVVLLAFNDSECATICPLTTTAMLDAQAMLGKAGSRVQLLGVDANPKSTSLEDVLSYSQLHGMLHAWHFLTGPLPALRRVWRAYGVEAAIQAGEIAHTPALFVIAPGGRLARLYITQQSYSAVGQLGKLVAEEASSLLPGRPAVHSDLSYGHIPGIAPAATATLPGAEGGTVELGPGRPRLYLFFATWDREILGLAGGLEQLERYHALARRSDLPTLTAIDEGAVEPRGALEAFLRTMPPLSYPLGIDQSGRVADGYEVESQPWLMLTSAGGRIVWYYNVAALGWPTTTHLVHEVNAALARVPATTANSASALAVSPSVLRALHAQAGRMLGAEPALAARVRALRGYPIVINAWASWCPPCRSEFGLLANASARYGRDVAFLGADIDDSAGDARAFLAQHPVSYPSYQATTTSMSTIAPGGLQGLPTTIFIDRSGRVTYVHTGQYDSQGTLDGDIETYALGR
jgi:cytochrome oxidase Cu insertion factor (SCO1/SenC/PrrC family)/thiol-disulfide isomerase/thioredoxin